MRKTKRRLTPREKFERTLKRKLRSCDSIKMDREYLVREYEKARKKADTVIKSAEAVARKVKIEGLHDTQLVFVGRASRPLYTTLRQASEELGLKRENIKLIDFSMIRGVDKSQAFIDYAKRLGIGVGKKLKPVMIIDAAGVTGGTVNKIAGVLMKTDPRMTSSDIKLFCLGGTEEKILLKKPEDLTLHELDEGARDIFEFWPRSVMAVTRHIGRGQKAKPVYKRTYEEERLRAWVYEQARQHRLKEWLKKKKV